MSFQPIHEMFRDAAGRFAGRAAMEIDGRPVTFRTLEEQSNRLANFLVRSGEAKEAVCGIYAESVAETVIAMLATLKAGGIFVILNPALPKARLEVQAAMVRPAWIFTEPRLLGRLRETLPLAGARVVCLGADRAGGEALAAAGPVAEEFAAFADLSATAGESHPDSPCYVYFTSGSTGKPKAILGRLSAIDHFVRWEIDTFGIREGSRVSQLTTPSFDAFLRDVFVPLCAGGTSVQPDRSTVLDGRKLADWLDVEEIELVHCVPSLFRTVLSTDLNPQYFAALRHVLMSGEPILPSDVERWTRTFGDRIQMVNLYGPSETTMTKFFYLVKPEDRERRSIPIGKPMPGAKAVLLDRAGKAVAPGAIGEVYIRTPYRTLGYLNDPEQTSRAFVRNPFGNDPADLIYKTGDLARALDDGNYEFLGRADQQVKIRGVRVELAEIENHLRLHPAVEDVAVVDRDDTVGTKFLCAYVVTRETVTAGALKEHLLLELPDYMVPTAFAFMKELPRTITGKVDRQALPASFDAGEGHAYVAPRTRTEETVAGIWTALLGIPRASVDQSFFELGGHSLLATQLLSRIRSTFDVELPLRALFDAPTLEKVAANVDLALAGDKRSAIPPLTRIPRGGPMPLSFSQERLWFLDQLQPGNAAYNIPQILNVRGALDVGGFRRSLEALVRRHESLRTSFPASAGKPTQVIHDSIPVEIPVVDLGGLPEVRREEALWPLLREEVRAPFDLSNGPVFRARLFRMSPALHTLALTLHHIVSDDWSRMIMTREWTTLYSSLVSGEAAVLPELPVQLADYAAWQRGWMSGPVLEEELAFWRRCLGTDSPILDLPTDRPRPAVMDFAGDGLSVWMPLSLAEGVNELCRAEGVTQFMVVMAAFQLLLSRYARQERVSVGTPIAGRSRTEIEGLIGFFVNTLVIRTDLSGDPSFRDYLRRVRQLALDVFDHQEAPFEKVVEAVQPERNRSYAPLFQVVFAMQNVPPQALQVGGLEFEVPYIDTGAVKADLDLDVVDSGDGLFAAISYARALFDRTTVQRLLGHLEMILTAVCRDADRRLSEIPLMTVGESHQLLQEWNDTVVAPAEGLPLHRLFEARVAAAPEATAVVHAGERLTYAELDRRANRLARHLQSLGVGPEVIVGLCTDRSFDLVVGVLGILKAGGAFLPLDPAYPIERLAFLMRDSQVTVLVSQEPLTDALPVHWGFTVYLDRERETIAGQDGAGLDGGTTAHNAAYVIYTSGSTGQPKGVVVPHRGLHNLAAEQERCFGVGPESRVLQFSSASFDASVFEMVMALASGAALCLGSREEIMPGAPLVDFLERERITTVTLPPSALAVTTAADLPELRTVTVAGEACPRDLVEAWAPGRRFFNLYGPTEATIWASMERCEPGEGDPTIGRPIANVRLYVAGPNLEVQPAGVPGELLIGGVGLSRGYHGQPDRTAEKLIPDLWSGEAGERLYRTGDLVRRLAGGRLQFLGRIDHQVKIRGFRIETQEVELALARNPAVAEAVVVVREDGGERRLVAYVSCHEWAAREPADLRGDLAEQLPEHMIPSAFVILDSLPHLPSGKIDRAALPAPDRAHLGLRRAVRLPTTPVEEVLVEVWREVLGFDEVGLDDSFFDLGGYSLAATQVLSRVREVFQIDYSLGKFFSSPTLAELAAGIETELRSSAAAAGEPLVALARDRDLFALSPAQQQVWNLYERAPGGPVDHIPAGFRLRGHLDVDALRAALGEVVARHEALRTSFPVVDGRRVQHIHPPAPVDLPVEDLRPLPEDIREEACAERVRDTVHREFDFEHGPLLRTLLLRMGEEDCALVFVCHHLIADQWSAGIFTRELSQLYTAFAAGKPSPLPPLDLQYADFSEWQNRELTGETLAGSLAYWQRQLKGAAPLALPGLRTPATTFGASAVEAFALSCPASEALRALGRERRATVFMTFLAAFKMLLAEVTGQHDVVVRTPIANRTRPEIEPLIGFFPNELVLRTLLDGDPTYLEVLDRVRDVTLGAYLHQSVPFETVAESMRNELPDAADLMRITCNYYNAPMSALALPGLELTPVDVGIGQMRRAMMFLLAEGEDGFEGSFHYRKDLLDPAFPRELASRFQALLESIAQDPSRRLSDLAVARVLVTA